MHPEPGRHKGRIWPVFLPFSGCPGKCVYCSQVAVTATRPVPPEQAYKTLESDLQGALDNGTRPLELGFFGGTFTALPAPWPQRFLALVGRFREAGLITSVRCSTRPDALAPGQVRQLAEQGLDMIELGIQTFHGPTLDASGRGYDPETAHSACRAVRDAGLALGIQLLPGLPKHSPRDLGHDAAAAAQHQPAAVRLYPCVVLKKTPLASAFRAGTYSPWALPETVSALAAALGIFWEQQIPVIRIGLAPEQDLQSHIIAGPWHPALGQLVRSTALFNFIRSRALLADILPTSLVAPRRYQSDILGHKGSMRSHYQAMGIANLDFDDHPTFRLA